MLAINTKKIQITEVGCLLENWSDCKTQEKNFLGKYVTEKWNWDLNRCVMQWNTVALKLIFCDKF